jgi:hypothetical protein
MKALATKMNTVTQPLKMVNNLSWILKDLPAQTKEEQTHENNVSSKLDCHCLLATKTLNDHCRNDQT